MSQRTDDGSLHAASHCVYRLVYHVIFVVKFRRHVISPEKLPFLNSTLSALAIDLDCSILEINGEDDHIHFLLDATTPTLPPSKAVGFLKAKSASAFLDRYGSFFWGRRSRTLWSSGYFVCSTGGANLETLKRYIQNQGPNPR